MPRGRRLFRQAILPHEYEGPPAVVLASPIPNSGDTISIGPEYLAVALTLRRAGGPLTFFILEEEVHRLGELGEEAEQIPADRQHDETAAGTPRPAGGVEQQGAIDDHSHADLRPQPGANPSEAPATHPDFSKRMAPRARFELAANRLTADCSTTELPRNKSRRRVLARPVG